MVTKVIIPEQHGKKVYDNKGSAGQLVNYLEKEQKEKAPEGLFFNHEQEKIKGDEVLLRIDNNVKGLRANEEKFHSLIISPSEQELQHLGNDEEKLKEYTRQVMENYAQNFKLKGGKSLKSEDLVWFANIHHEREYKGSDPEVREGKAKAGEKKPGLQTHIHVTVSARDAAQKITLHPNGRKERFNQGEWTQKNREDFERMYGYVHKPTPEQHQERIEKQVAKLPQELDKQRVLAIAQAANYSPQFYRNLSNLRFQVDKTASDADAQKRVLEGSYELLSRPAKDNRMDYLQKRLDSIMSQQQLSEKEFDTRAVTQIAQERGYERSFYRSLRSLEGDIKRTGTVPKDYLKTLQSEGTAVKAPRSPAVSFNQEHRQTVIRSEKTSLNAVKSGFYTLRSLMSAPSYAETGVGRTAFEQRDEYQKRKRQQRNPNNDDTPQMKR